MRNHFRSSSLFHVVFAAAAAHIFISMIISKETIIEKGAEIEFSERKPALSVYSATGGKNGKTQNAKPAEAG
ncbi:MAG: hypothetical protein ACI3VK_00065 [Oscillospiraceae bacterium]